MLQRTLGITTLALAAAAAPTRADIMHWFWEVEVNGQAVDASRPIAVEAGDHLNLRLSASMSPGREGFAESYFAITLDEQFFLTGAVDIESSGYGLSERLDDYSAGIGRIADADGNGRADMIDDINPFQVPNRIPPHNTDMSNPIFVYAFGWTMLPDGEINAPITIARAPTLAGDFVNAVYLDGWGARAEYDSQSDQVVIVPAPSVLSCLVGTALWGISIRWKTHRMRGERSGT
jgi:hypothetical protein